MGIKKSCSFAICQDFRQDIERSDSYACSMPWGCLLAQKQQISLLVGLQSGGARVTGMQLDNHLTNPLFSMLEA